jgi:hypothetical protein
MRKLSLIVLAASAALTPAVHASTSQFVARLYTEALGRAPDEGAWAANVATLPQSGAACNNIDFASLANSVYSSQEYQNLGYTSKEKVLTLYRGIVNREPENANAVNYWAQGLDSGQSILSVINAFMAGAEFQNLKSQICSTTSNTADPVYRWGSAPAVAIDGPASGMTAADLQILLNNARNNSSKVVALAPHTVVFADRKITIPEGVTLTTSGVTSRQQYARMARIVRIAHFGAGSGARGDQALVVPDKGSTMKYIWVSGQRDAVINGVRLEHNGLSANVHVRNGTGTSVISSRLDSVAGTSNIGVDGSAEGDGSLEGVRCDPPGAVISDNLITGYTSTHYPIGIDGKYSDGITVSCERTSVTRNHVVDASDVGIILFRSGRIDPKHSELAFVKQQSVVSDNVIISAGVSAFAAMAYEPYNECNHEAPCSPPGPTPVTYSFAGSSFSNNRFWTAGDTHFDIGIAVGTRAWAEDNTGDGGQVVNNSNMGIASVMMIGIGLDGMTNTRISGNQLSYVKQNNGKCPTKAPIVINTDPSRSGGVSGVGSNFTPGALDNCRLGDH